MLKSGQPPAPTHIPAAEYVRMSDKQQEYSIANQKSAIREYAAAHGFVVVKTYTDADRSGVSADRRTALRELLKDVVSGYAEYQAVLVYDVSRWGRFRNTDEGAHYEFLCHSSGIPLHYCAEPFANDGSASSFLLKTLKRSMAAEFSRELGEKVYRGKQRLVELGYWVGGRPGFGYRRMLVSASGSPRGLMKEGEGKNLKTDRVILVPGPLRERSCVQLIFSMASQGNGPTAIARELSERCIRPDRGECWQPCSVASILKNPKYWGCNAWNRTTQRLQQKRRPLNLQDWILKPGAFAPIIDQQTFDRAAAASPKRSDESWSDEEILRRVRRLLKAKGRLSETLLLKARGMPATSTIHRHFGSYRQLYERVGYRLETIDVQNNAGCEATLQLRRKVVTTIRQLFPDKVAITHLPGKTRSMFLIDNTFMVSILLCRDRISEAGRKGWSLEPRAAERHYITLVCAMNKTRDRVLHYFVLRSTDDFRSACFHDSFLRRAERLPRLADFYQKVKTLWARTSAEPGSHRR
jgi:DNA invertase Pin-like site-specific DNA recombinase